MAATRQAGVGEAAKVNTHLPFRPFLQACCIRRLEAFGKSRKFFSTSLKGEEFLDKTHSLSPVVFCLQILLPPLVDHRFDDLTQLTLPLVSKNVSIAINIQTR